MSYRAPELCRGEYHSRMQQKYREGYHLGISQQPIQGAVAGRPGWTCKNTVRNKTGNTDRSRCGSAGATIACFEDVEEYCIRNATGQESRKSFRRFTGRCVSAHSRCW